MNREELRREYALKLKFTTSSTRITQLLLEYDKKLQELDSLPPTEGAEAIVKKYEDEYDFKFHWVQRDRVIRMMREFAAQQPKLDPKKVQWSGYGELGNISQKPLQPTAEGAEEILASLIEGLGEPDNSIHYHSYEIRPLTVNGKCEWWMFHNGVGSGEPLAQWLQNFATLHAQRIADKMVSERLRGKYVFTYEELRKVCCDFFRSWWNAPGSNTDEGFDAWALKTGLKK